MSRPLKYTVSSLVILLVAGFYSIRFFSSSKISVPEEFTTSRMKSAEIGRNIKALSSNSLNNLRKIAEFDETGKTSSALALVSEEISNAQKSHGQAVELSKELEIMAKDLKLITPQSAKIVATEALTSQVTLVGRLLSYNNYLKELFDVLKSKFESGIKTDGRVKELVNSINYEVQAINSLSAESSAIFGTLDALIKEEGN